MRIDRDSAATNLVSSIVIAILITIKFFHNADASHAETIEWLLAGRGSINYLNRFLN